jgi:hypothetical protein
MEAGTITCIMHRVAVEGVTRLAAAEIRQTVPTISEFTSSNSVHDKLARRRHQAKSQLVSPNRTRTLFDDLYPFLPGPHQNNATNILEKADYKIAKSITITGIASVLTSLVRDRRQCVSLNATPRARSA